MFSRLPFQILGISQWACLELYRYLIHITVHNSCHKAMSWISFHNPWQSQKTAELLLDLNVSTIVSSPKNASVEMATTISRVSSSSVLESVCWIYIVGKWVSSEIWLVEEYFSFTAVFFFQPWPAYSNAGARSCRLLGCWLCAAVCRDETDPGTWCQRHPSTINQGKIWSKSFGILWLFWVEFCKKLNKHAK